MFLETIRNLKRIIYNKYGNEIEETTITNLVYLPGYNFNIFSITKNIEDVKF